MNDTNSPPDDGTASQTPEGSWCVRLPDHVGEKVETRLPGTNFGSVEEYVAFVLESVLRELEEGDHDDAPDHSETTSEDTEGIEDRLESLGYL